MLKAITLGARRKSGTDFSSGRVDNNAVWKQDDFICQFCGFRAEKFQRVIPGAWCDDRRPALTACLFCEQCFTLDSTGSAGAGFLIWLPEIEQAELNHLCRAIYLAKTNPAMEERAQTALDALTTRRAEAKKRLGTDDPLLLGTVLLEGLREEDYAKRQKKLAGIRYLPLDRYLVTTRDGVIDQFPIILNYWQSSFGPFGKIPVASWMAITMPADASDSSQP